MKFHVTGKAEGTAVSFTGITAAPTQLLHVRILNVSHPEAGGGRFEVLRYLCRHRSLGVKPLGFAPLAQLTRNAAAQAKVAELEVGADGWCRKSGRVFRVAISNAHCTMELRWKFQAAMWATMGGII